MVKAPVTPFLTLSLVSVAVALILFEGGLSLNFRELRKTDGAVTRLVLLGAPIGWVLGAVACFYVAGLVWPVAILFAGILVVTGPTVVLPLLPVIARMAAVLSSRLAAASRARASSVSFTTN